MAVISGIYELTVDILAAQDTQTAAEGYFPVLHRDRVIAYLQASEVMAMTSGRMTDEYTGERVESCCMNYRTDGVYAWDEHLAYYVDKYGILPPSDFLEHIYCKLGIAE